MVCNNFFLILCGPTGVGKTELSYELSKKYPLEILNCDVGQFYEPLTIGTAKPNWKNNDVQHHLFDIVKDPKNFSVTDYRACIEKKLKEIWGRNRIPVLVGGSMFYIRALFFPPISQKCTEAQSDEIVAMRQKTTEELWVILSAIDPERSRNINKNDRYRIERALCLFDQAKGILPSECKPVFTPLARFHITFITRERDDLYARINHRVQMMLDDGWVEEVFKLSESWKNFLLQKKILGYPEILLCLEKNTRLNSNESIDFCKKDELLQEAIQKKTRNYAKRQITFWRSLKRDIAQSSCQEVISELNLTLSSVDLYLKNMQQILKENCE